MRKPIAVASPAAQGFWRWRWLQGLRSDQFTQIRGSARDGRGGVCAVGVLISLLVADGLMRWTSASNPLIEGTLPWHLGQQVVQWNDVGLLSFPEIAARLEAMPGFVDRLSRSPVELGDESPVAVGYPSGWDPQPLEDHRAPVLRETELVPV